MRESFQTRISRWMFNFFPVYRRTGGRVTFIADDYSEVHVKIPLNRKTKNYVGTIFGGSMYGAVDPVYMIMFIKLLGTKYTVWDKSGIIHHKKPGRSLLHAKFSINQMEIENIKHELEGQDKINRSYRVELLDKDNAICALIEKTLYFSKKNP